MTPEQVFAPALERFPVPMRRDPLALGVARTLVAWRAIWAQQARAAKQAQLVSISRTLQAAHEQRARLVAAPELRIIVP